MLKLILCFSCLFASEDVATIFTPQGNQISQEEGNKRLIQNYYRAFQENNAQALLATLAPNYGILNANLVNDTSYYPYPTMSKNQKVRMGAFHYSFPDLRIQVMELIAEQNRVFAYVTYSGTQKGPFLGIMPTNKPLVIKQFAVFSVENGRIVHITEMDNEYSVMEQIGYVLIK